MQAGEPIAVRMVRTHNAAGLQILVAESADVNATDAQVSPMPSSSGLVLGLPAFRVRV